MRHLKNLVLIMGILVSLIALVQLFSVFSLLLLVPWDTSFVRPDVGTWQRTVNDFFESRPGEILTYGFYTLFFSLVTINTLRKRWEAAYSVIVVNLIATFSLQLLGVLSFPVSQFVFPFNENYTNPFYFNYARNVLPMLMIVAMVFLWTRELKRLQQIPEKAKNKAKNQMQAEETSISRLSLNHEAASDEQIPAAMQERLSSS